ncbi:hypothetical protein [Flavobacterium sp.]|uniref:hypothetical protein n=1 Tax=Flavobacterium sp. TaxID=239 RepID=UPI002FD8C769
MKKIYLVVAFVAVLFTACSSDSNTSSTSGLLKEIQMTTVSLDNTSSMTLKYSYNGNKLSTIKREGYWESHYTYTGNLITSVSNYDHGDLLLKIDYEYDNQDRLISSAITEYQQGFSDFTTYSYNTDNTVTKLSYNGTPQNPEDLYLTSKITLDDQGRFVKLEDFDEGAWVTKTQATYASNFSPWRNVIGFDKFLIFTDGKNLFATYDQLNNVAGYNNSSVFEYTLNGLNYPTQCIQTLTNSDGSTSVTTSNYSYY